VDPNDPNLNDTHVYTVTQTPLHGAAEISANGQVTYTADLDYVGADEFTVVVTDDRGLSGTVVIEVDVRAEDPAGQSHRLESGCGCAAGGATGTAWLWGLVPLLLLWRRRADS
jgi:MYXO-CTERM domain-containing protein